MEEKGNKGNQVLLTVIGVATLLVAVIGATFAYFTANGVQNNVTTNNIQAQTAKYGDITVYYDATYPSINTGLLDLKQTEAGDDYQYLMKFRVATTSDVARKLTINWANVTNTFCRKVDNQNSTTCNNASGALDVSDEVVYDFYNCNSSGYSNTVKGDTTATERTITVGTGCTKISAQTSAAVPATSGTGLLHTAASLDLAATGTNYYAVVVTIKNKNAAQNYQQEKSFAGRVIVAVVQQ